MVPLAARVIPQAAPALARAMPGLVSGVAGVVRTLHSDPVTRPLVRVVPAYTGMIELVDPPHPRALLAAIGEARCPRELALPARAAN
jgi:hypothetical protein